LAIAETEQRAAPTTIVLADDHTIVRSALRALLEAEEEFVVVAEAGEVEEAVAGLGLQAADARA
jgi:DNA-binding NarL/FixJ family response regulator